MTKKDLKWPMNWRYITKKVKYDGPTDRRTDGPTDGPTKRGVESRAMVFVFRVHATKKWLCTEFWILNKIVKSRIRNFYSFMSNIISKMVTLKRWMPDFRSLSGYVQSNKIMDIELKFCARDQSKELMKLFITIMDFMVFPLLNTEKSKKKNDF